jgi:O-antigen/teichoic acid export membrane protein
MYGLWSYVLAVCAFINIVANPGLGTYAAQQVASRREAAFDLIPDILSLRLVSSLVASVPLFVIASFEARPEVRQLFHWFGIGILIINILNSDYLLTALEMFHANSFLTIVQQGLYAIGVFKFIRSPKDILWLPGSILGSSLLTSVSGWVVLWRHGFRMTWRIQPERWKGILGPSLHYAASSVMSNLYARTGHIIVHWFLGDYALGLYAATTRFVDISRNFVLIALNVLTPRMALAARTEAGLGRLARFAFVVVAALSIPLMLGLIGTAQLIVPWLMGAKYLGAVPLLRWMAPYIVMGSFASLLSGTILYAMGRYRAYLASTGGGAIAGILLYAPLIAILGLRGACLALVLAEATVAGIAYFLLPRELHSVWRNPMVGYVLLSGLAMLCVVRILNHYTSNPLAVISTGGFVYVILCFWPFKKWLVSQLASST